MALYYTVPIRYQSKMRNGAYYVLRTNNIPTNIQTKRSIKKKKNYKVEVTKKHAVTGNNVNTRITDTGIDWVDLDSEAKHQQNGKYFLSLWDWYSDKKNEYEISTLTGI